LDFLWFSLKDWGNGPAPQESSQKISSQQSENRTGGRGYLYTAQEILKSLIRPALTIYKNRSSTLALLSNPPPANEYNPEEERKKRREVEGGKRSKSERDGPRGHQSMPRAGSMGSIGNRPSDQQQMLRARSTNGMNGRGSSSFECSRRVSIVDAMNENRINGVKGLGSEKKITPSSNPGRPLNARSMYETSKQVGSSKSPLPHHSSSISTGPGTRSGESGRYPVPRTRSTGSGGPGRHR